MQHARGKSALVFCSTRKGAQEAAQSLSQTVMNLGHSNPFIKFKEQQDRLKEASLSFSDKQMQSCIIYGGTCRCFLNILQPPSYRGFVWPKYLKMTAAFQDRWSYIHYIHDHPNFLAVGIKMQFSLWSSGLLLLSKLFNLALNLGVCNACFQKSSAWWMLTNSIPCQRICNTCIYLQLVIITVGFAWRTETSLKVSFLRETFRFCALQILLRMESTYLHIQ